MKFRKKPVVMEAVQLTWSNWSEVCEFVPKRWFKCCCYLDVEGNPAPDGTVTDRMGLILQTLQSQEFVVRENDWIIKGVQGELYPCKPDIFAATYEAAE